MSLKALPKRSPAPPPNKAVAGLLSEILGRFSDANAVVETACRAMESGEDYTVEMSALRSGLRMLAEVYDDLDRAITTLAPPVFPKDAA